MTLLVDFPPLITDQVVHLPLFFDEDEPVPSGPPRTWISDQ